MSTIALPIDTKDYIPTLPEFEPKELTWKGKVIRWIRDSREEGCIFRTTVLALSIFISILLITSIFFSPIFISGFREFVRQEECAKHKGWREKVLKAATEHSLHQFRRGRIEPLTDHKFTLRSSTRNHITYDLDITAEQAKQKTDLELLRMAAIKFDNFFERYKLKIYS